MKKLLSFMFLGMLGTASVDAASITLPKPVFYQDFEKATKPSDVGTLVGDGSIESDNLFGKYYQNMPNATVSTARSNYLAMPDGDAFLKVQDTNSGEMSVSFWVNTTVHMEKNLGLAWNTMFTAYTDDGYSGQGHYYRAVDLHTNGSSHARFSFYSFHNTHDSQPAFRNTENNWAVTKGWHHVAYVMSNNASHVKFYVDGNVIEEFDITCLATTMGEAIAKAQGYNGWIYNNTESYWKALGDATTIVLGGLSAEWVDDDVAFGYDEVAVYSKALTENQIKKIMIDKFGRYTTTAKFKQSSRTITLSDTYTQTVATNSDATNITYKSSNTKVAEVDAKTGKVTPKALGLVTITATIPATDLYEAGEASYNLKVSTTPYPQSVAYYSFEDDSPENSPEVTRGIYETNTIDNQGHRVLYTWEGTRTPDGETGHFMGLVGANYSNGICTLPFNIDNEVIAAAPGWQIEYDFGGYGGCNEKLGNFDLIARTAEGVEISLYSLKEYANWGNTRTLNYGANTATLDITACDKTTRGSVDAAKAITNRFWYHYTVTGSINGVFLTVQKYDAEGFLAEEPIVKKAKISSEVVYPDRFEFTVGSMAADALDELHIDLVEVTETFSDYTIKYVDENGKKLREDDVVPNGVIVGESFTADGSQMAEFFNDDQSKKYTYVSGNQEKVAVAKASNNVITLVFRELPQYEYVIRASHNGQILGAFMTGTGFEGEVKTLRWSKYMKYQGDKWGKCSQYSAVVSQDTIITVEFADANISDFIEAEDMDCSKTYGQASGTIYSGGYAPGVAQLNHLTTRTKLPAGNYNFTIGTVARRTGDDNVDLLYSTDGENWNILGNLDIWSDAANVERETTLDFVNLPEDAYVRIAETTDRNMLHYIDYVTVTVATTFTVHYRSMPTEADPQGKDIKPAATHGAVVGNMFSALDSDLESFFNDTNDKKYEYVSGNIETKADANPMRNSLYLYFKELDVFNYEIRATYNGQQIGIIGSGSAFSDGSTVVNWSKYMNFDGKWYRTDATSFQKQITEAYFADVEFTPVSITYFEEAENMQRDKEPAAWAFAAEYSNGRAPRHYYMSSWWTTDTLNAGTYVIDVAYTNPNTHESAIDIMTRDTLGVLYPTGRFVSLNRMTTATVTVSGVNIPQGHSLVLANNTGNNSNGFIDYIVVTQPTTYAVRYWDIDGEFIRQDLQPRSTNVGLEYSCDDRDLEMFYSQDGSAKYVFQDYKGEPVKVAVADPEQNYIDLIFNQYEKVDYSLNAVCDGEVLKPLADQNVYTDVSLTVYWTKYINVNDQWYENDYQAFGKPYYGLTIEEGGDYDIPFLEADIKKVFECENLYATDEKSTLAAENALYSNGGAHRIFGGSQIQSYPLDGGVQKDLTAGIVPAGLYDITVKAQSGKSGITTIGVLYSTDGKNWVDTEKRITFASSKSQEVTVSMVTIPVDAYIAIKEYDNRTTVHFLDYIAFAPCKEVIVLGQNGISTFSSDYNWYAKVKRANSYYSRYRRDGYADMVPMKEDMIVAPGEGAVFQGKEGDEVFVYLSHLEGQNIAGNNLIGVNSSSVAFLPGTNYVIASKGTQSAFVHMKAGKTIEQMMYKAYLNMPSGSKLQTISLAFEGDEDEDPTAVGVVEVDTNVNSKFVNAAGQAVSKSYKGVVIDENGNKLYKK